MEHEDRVNHPYFGKKFGAVLEHHAVRQLLNDAPHEIFYPPSV
jgi:hypothetical protein